MESSIAEFLMWHPDCELLPTHGPFHKRFRETVLEARADASMSHVAGEDCTCTVQLNAVRCAVKMNECRTLHFPFTSTNKEWGEECGR